MDINLMGYLKDELKDYTWYTRNIETDDTGLQTSVLATAGMGAGDLQPVTERIIQAEAGQDTRTTNVLYTGDNLNIKAGDVIEIDEVQYTVKEVKDYGTHKEINLYVHS